MATIARCADLMFCFSTPESSNMNNFIYFPSALYPVCHWEVGTNAEWEMYNFIIVFLSRNIFWWYFNIGVNERSNI